MALALSNTQTRYLRGLAHPIKPLLQVGAKGVTPSLLAELDQLLELHELVKAKVAAEDRESRAAMIQALVEGTGSALVQVIGHTAVLYKPSKDHVQIVLPKKK